MHQFKICGLHSAWMAIASNESILFLYIFLDTLFLLPKYQHFTLVCEHYLFEFRFVILLRFSSTLLSFMSKFPCVAPKTRDSEKNKNKERKRSGENEAKQACSINIYHTYGTKQFPTCTLAILCVLFWTSKLESFLTNLNMIEYAFISFDSKQADLREKKAESFSTWNRQKVKILVNRWRLEWFQNLWTNI